MVSINGDLGELVADDSVLSASNTDACGTASSHISTRLPGVIVFRFQARSMSTRVANVEWFACLTVEKQLSLTSRRPMIIALWPWNGGSAHTLLVKMGCIWLCKASTHTHNAGMRLSCMHVVMIARLLCCKKTPYVYWFKVRQILQLCSLRIVIHDRFL